MEPPQEDECVHRKRSSNAKDGKIKRRSAGERNRSEKSQDPRNRRKLLIKTKTESESSIDKLDRRIGRSMEDTNKNNRRRLRKLKIRDSFSTFSSTASPDDSCHTRSSVFSDDSCNTRSTVCSDESYHTRSTLDSTLCRNSRCHRRSKRVTFSTVEYREYRMTVAYGRAKVPYPMTLDWCYNGNTKIVDLRNNADSYEQKKMKPINSEQRQQRLLANGVSRGELLALERRRRIQMAGEWAFSRNNSGKNRPSFISENLLQYAIN